MSETITEEDVRRHLTVPDVSSEDVTRSIAVAAMLQACDPDRSAANAALIAQAIHETRSPQSATGVSQADPAREPTVRIDKLIIHRALSRSLRIGSTDLSPEASQEPPAPV